MIEGRTAGIMGIRSHISYHFKAGAVNITINLLCFCWHGLRVVSIQSCFDTSKFLSGVNSFTYLA